MLTDEAAEGELMDVVEMDAGAPAEMPGAEPGPALEAEPDALQEAAAVDAAGFVEPPEPVGAPPAPETERAEPHGEAEAG